MQKRRASSIAALILCAVFAVTSFALADSRDVLWWGGWFWTVGFLALLIPPSWKPFIDELQITDLGVTRRFGARLRRKKEESVSWQDLTKVEILTTDGGPWSEDFFFILHGPDGKGVAISNDVAVRHDLVAALQRRLAGLDNKAIIEASGSTEVRRFLLWQKTG